MDLVSIVTVCYNSEKTIRKTIESVYRQTYRNIEYIIIDGKSTDGTMEIVEEYKSLFGTRLKVISEPDDGIYDAMNKGISLANGKVVGIINSDDYYEEDAVEIMMNTATDDKYQILYGMINYIKQEKLNSICFFSAEFLEERTIYHPAVFVSKAIYDDYRMFNLDYKYVADYDFFFAMKKIEDIKFIPIYRVLANFTEGGASSSYKCDLELLKFRRAENLISNYKYVVLYVRRLIGYWFGF